MALAPVELTSGPLFRSINKARRIWGGGAIFYYPFQTTLRAQIGLLCTGPGLSLGIDDSPFQRVNQARKTECLCSIKAGQRRIAASLFKDTSNS